MSYNESGIQGALEKLKQKVQMKMQLIDGDVKELREMMKEQNKKEKEQHQEIRQMKSLDAENVKVTQDFTGVHDLIPIKDLVDLVQIKEAPKEAD